MLSEVVDESASTPRRSISAATASWSSGSSSRGLAVADELDRLEAAHGAHVADPLEALAQLGQPRASPTRLQLAHVLEHRLGGEEVERRQRGGARTRQPRPGAPGRDVVEAAERALGAQAARRSASRRRRAPCRGTSGRARRPSARPRAGGPSGPCPVFTSSAQSSQPCSRQSVGERRPEAVRRRHAAARAEDRLDHDAGDVGRVEGVEEDVVADVVDGRVAAAAGSRIAKRGPVRVRVGDVDEPGDQPAQPAARSRPPRRRAPRSASTRRGRSRGSR